MWENHQLSEFISLVISRLCLAFKLLLQIFFVLLLYYFRLYLSCKCITLKLFVTVISVTEDWELQSERKRRWWYFVIKSLTQDLRNMTSLASMTWFMTSSEWHETHYYDMTSPRSDRSSTSPSPSPGYNHLQKTFNRLLF